MPACAKKTNRKGQSKLFSVIDTLGRARAGNKAGIEAQHSLGGCWERADAGLCPPCCAAATRTRGALARWVAGHGLGLLLSQEGERNVASCARVCQGWEVAGNSGVCRDSGGEKAQGQGDYSSASEVPGEGWLWDTGPDTECCQRFWAHLAQQRPSAHQALGKGSLGMDTGHCSGRCRPCAVPHCTALPGAAPSPTNRG